MNTVGICKWLTFVKANWYVRLRYSCLCSL